VSRKVSVSLDWCIGMFMSEYAASWAVYLLFVEENISDMV
jgi:hypothetical protein